MATALLCLNIPLIAQNVTINLNNVSVKQAMDELKSITGYTFVYSSNDLDSKKKISVSANDEDIEAVIGQILNGQKVSYEIKDKTIIVKKITNTTNTQQSAPKKITGTVVDDAGIPVIGANVMVKGTTNGTITDMDGRFTLDVPKDAVLEVSYIGYSSQMVKVGEQKNLTITLSEDTQALDEIVVVGYGVQRKKDVAGAISSVSSKDLLTQSVNNIQNVLQGRLSGVSVSTSGVAGEAPSIRIRGIGTLSDNKPLYVIDGFPTKSELASQINPSSIESVQVLKDASSASIYGAQAANGVILITTKQGQKGKSKFDVKLNMGVQLPCNLPEMLNTQQYGEVLWAAMKNAGITPSHSQYGSGPNPVIPDYILPAGAFEGDVDLDSYNTAENQYMRANKVGTDWAKEVYRPAQTTNVDISAQGGGENSKYFLNANYFSQDALLKYSGYDRFSVRSNSQFNIMKNVNFGANISAMYSKYKGSTNSGDAMLSTPIMPVYDVQGNWAGTKATGLGDATNPVAKLYNNKDNYSDKLNLLGNLFLDISFLNCLQFRSNVGVNFEGGDSRYFSPLTFWEKGDKNTLVNSLSVVKTNNVEFVWNNTLTFTKTFNDNHKLNVLIGSEMINSKNTYLSASRDGFIVEDVDYRYLDAGELNKNNSENASEYALFSLFSRINYQYKDKYYLGAVIRRDGSSRFGPNNRYGYFPGVNAAWRISEEAFMDSQDIFSDLKLRASYGLTGNQDIGNYAYSSIYGANISTSSYPMAGNPNSVDQGVSKEAIGNPNIKWETTSQFNVGIDAGLIENKLNFGLDLYRKYTYDILQRVAYPATGGVATAPYQNIGEMLNIGYEFNVNYNNFSDNNEFKYELGLVLSGYKNEVKKLASDQFISGDYTRTEVGHPISSFYGYVIDGIFQTQEEVDAHAEQTSKAVGRWKYRDVNGDNVIDDKDRTYIGSPHPKFEYSLNGRFYYKNFDMSIYIQGVYGNDICFASKGGKQGLDFWGDYFNKSTRILDTWTENNRDASLPEINILNPNDEINKVSTYLIEDGSYLRIKTLEIGYTIPTNVMSKIKMNQCRVYLNAENLLTLTKYNNIDPEIKNSNDLSIGVDYVNSMPLARIFSVGFNLSF